MAQSHCTHVWLTEEESTGVLIWLSKNPSVMWRSLRWTSSNGWMLKSNVKNPYNFPGIPELRPKNQKNPDGWVTEPSPDATKTVYYDIWVRPSLKIQDVLDARAAPAVVQGAVVTETVTETEQATIVETEADDIPTQEEAQELLEELHEEIQLMEAEIRDDTEVDTQVIDNLVCRCGARPPCDPSVKIFNDATGRCVLKSGKIGQSLMRKAAKI